MCRRHEEDVRRQQLIASEVKGSLDAQVAAVRQRQQAEAQQEALEVQRMQQHWAQLQVRVTLLLPRFAVCTAAASVRLILNRFLTVVPVSDRACVTQGQVTPGYALIGTCVLVDAPAGGSGGG